MVAEIERRFLVKDYDQIYVDRRAKDFYVITQGYIDAPGKVRVRRLKSSKGDEHAEITRKIGKGLVRDEISESISPDAARMLLSCTPFVLRKIRQYMPDGWEVDVFQDKLKGLVLAEHECDSEEEARALKLPEWILEATEVTDTITNGRLAEIAYHINEGGDVQEEVKKAPIPKFVLTGGPCSGKSTILKALRERMPEFYFMPETATIIMDQVGMTPQVSGGRSFQRTIYKVQRTFEEGAEKQARKLGKRAMILDRGTVDAVAFTSGWEEFGAMTRSSAEEETERYTAVLLCEVPPKEIYDAHKADNPVRTETWEQSMAIQERLEKAWMERPHNYLYRISWSERGHFEEKVNKVRETIEGLVK